MTFYLGKEVESGKPLEVNAKDLTTHAVCVGMTGSGKTGLGIALIEEAALNNIPSIVIDPKGDLGNLLLTFPDLTPEEFAPWVEDGDPKAVAKTWRDGLAKWNEGTKDIKKLRETVDMAIYTPASRSGIPISILSSFNAPEKLDDQTLRDRVMSLTSSLLGLLGINADPLKSREHILISTIITNAWNNKEDLDIETLIDQVQNPPFSKIGALDTDTFFPPKERKNLSISLNNLLASPGFHAWMEGDPLDIQTLFYTKEGKAKVSVISIAHLSDSERMFFVTLLLNEMISWMRRQPGTSNLRGILYMDEIFGFFPPTATPPSKLPMLTLLKQARAFGIGVVLATQNPVDLDYKGLANCGIWFIGKLQTERDKARVVEGLNGDIGKDILDKTGKRIFVMRSVYVKEPILFETRWTLSYLRGPLTLEQIAKLTPHQEVKTREVVGNVFYIPKPLGTYHPYVYAVSKTDSILAPLETPIEWTEGEKNPQLKMQRGCPTDEKVDFDEESVKKSFRSYLGAQKLGDKYAAKRALIEERIKSAQNKISEGQSKSNWRKFDTLVSIGSAILGAFIGKKVTKGTISQASTGVRKAGRLDKDSKTISKAQDDLDKYKQQLQDLDAQIETESQGENIPVDKVILVWK